MEYKYKLAVVGGAGVGKSALTMQFVEKNFVVPHKPDKEDSFWARAMIDAGMEFLEIQVFLCDDYPAMREVYKRKADGFIIVYSVTSRSSFEETPLLYQEVLRSKDEDKVPVVLVGNKCDLDGEREVGEQEGKEYAATIHCPFFETSARAAINVEEAFNELIREIRLKEEEQKRDRREQKKF